MSADIREQLQSTLSGSYTLERELGGGGMSRVFVADEMRLKRKVVVKVLSPELAQGISAERFEREIQLAASLQQANIVPVLSAGDAGGMPYYTMPLVDGESLRARLGRGPLSIAEVTSILRDVARALAYAHEHGIVHRDIKPDNVLLSRGTAVVTDFGIAKALAAAQMHAPGATLTQIGTALGTPAYMAPEQSAGDPETDHRADIYAFGCMGYELLTGHPPFDARSLQQLLRAHMSEVARPVTELRPDTPIELASLIARCMAKEASLRPQTADELLATLETTPTSDAAQPAMPAILLGGRGMLQRALALYAAAFIVVAIVAKAAIVGIGLPDWVFPGALIVMGLGLPVILFTGYTQLVARRVMTTSPRLTPGGSPVTHGTMANIAIKASPHLSWRRTTVGFVYAVGAFVLAIGVFMLLRAFGIGPAGSLFAAGRLHARDMLVVSDFRVKGADSSLGSVVSEAVRTQLAQSEVISIVSPATVAAALGRMQRPRTTPVDLSLAREIAVREGAKAVVDGDITPLGAGFVLSLRLVTADSGAELASFHATADAPKDLLPTLDKLVRDLRGKMGESLKRVHADPPLEQVTTPSLEALRKFADGRRANNIEGDFAKSAALLEEAIALDTTFAMAYRSLGIAYGNLNFPREKADSAYAKAYRYRDRLSERERYLAVANYFGGPARDRARMIAAYEDYLARYPHDYSIYTNLGVQYDSRRAWTHAESLFRRSIAENPGMVVPYGNLVRNLVSQGRLDAAAEVRAEAQRRFAGSPVVEGLEIFELSGRGALDSMAAVLQHARSTTRSMQNRVRATNTLAAIALTRGQLATAIRYRNEGLAMNSARGGSVSPYDSVLAAASLDAWFREQPTRAVQALDSALARIPIRTLPVDLRSDFAIASMYAIAARPDRARAVIAEFDAEVRDTTVRRSFEPARHAALGEIALAEGRARDAIEEFRKSDVEPDGPAGQCAPCVYASLARAFDLAGMGDSAIANFERYLSTPYSFRFTPPADPIHLAGTYKRLGELYEGKGDRQKAASYYTKFIELWKNADPELQPKVADAKKRLARLSDVEPRR